MKLFLPLFFLLCFSSAGAQYFYKDIIGTKETSDLIKRYLDNKVSGVQLSSYDANNTKIDKFFVAQSVTPQTVKTTTRSGDESGSVLTAYINNNRQVVRTVDSSEALISITTFSYNPSGNIVSIVSTSADSSKTFVQTEAHIWEYNGDKIERMLRIKNGVDTSIVTFEVDEAGNVSEEKTLQKGVTSGTVFYFYNAQNQLTDIVRYNEKVKRLLPEYMFEYSPAGQVIQKITVPANNSNYLIWRYQYDGAGLKIKEAIYTREKELTGKIEYTYQKG